MIFFPMDLLQSVGIGSAVALIMALSVNLTLNPSLLFILTPFLMKIHHYVNLEKLPIYKQDPSKPPKYNLDLHNDNFEKEYQLWKMKKSKKIKNSLINEEEEVITPLLHTSNANGRTSNLGEEDENDDMMGLSNGMSSLNMGSDSVTSLSPSLSSIRSSEVDKEYEEEDNMAIVVQSWWYYLGSVLMKSTQAIIILLVIVALTIPIDEYAFDVKTTIGFDSMVPHDSDSWEGYKDVSHSFGPGSLSIYRIVFENDDDQNMMSNERFCIISFYQFI